MNKTWKSCMVLEASRTILEGEYYYRSMEVRHGSAPVLAALALPLSFVSTSTRDDKMMMMRGEEVWSDEI